MRRTRALIGALLATGSVGSSACHREPTAPEATPRIAACDTVGIVSISPGPTPVIAWSAPCGLGSVSVFRAVDTAAMWSAFNVDNQLVSPITYGARPSNASPGSPATPLVAGQTYRLLLGYNPPAPPGAVIRFVTVVSQQEFVP